MTDWMATVQQIADIRPAAELVVLEELDFEPACEGPFHPRGKYGHHPEEPASWMVTAPCGDQSLFCDGWVQDCLQNLVRQVDCKCGSFHLLRHLSYVPIGKP